LSAKKKISIVGAAATALLLLSSGAFFAIKSISGDKKKKIGGVNPEAYVEKNNFPSLLFKKIALIGDARSGKTAFIERMSNGMFNSDERPPTMGGKSYLMEREFGNQKVRFDFWDTAGEERYRALISVYFRGADLILIFINSSEDINSQLDYWLDFFKSSVGNEAKAMVILSRLDLVKKAQDIELIKKQINQSIAKDPDLSKRVTLFSEQISSESIDSEVMQKFEGEIYKNITS
jgi:small GTP-binding protein